MFGRGHHQTEVSRMGPWTHLTWKGSWKLQSTCLFDPTDALPYGWIRVTFSNQTHPSKRSVPYRFWPLSLLFLRQPHVSKKPQLSCYHWSYNMWQPEPTIWAKQWKKTGPFPFQLIYYSHTVPRPSQLTMGGPHLLCMRTFTQLEGPYSLGFLDLPPFHLDEMIKDDPGGPAGGPTVHFAGSTSTQINFDWNYQPK